MTEIVSKNASVVPTGKSSFSLLKMIGADRTLTLLLTVVQVLTGVSANGLIVTVNAIGLMKQRKIAALDLLLSCLAISRIFLQLCMIFFLMIIFSGKEFIMPATIVIILFTNELGLWFATWLSVFYCTKIASIPHWLFLWLKMRISRLVPWLIVGSLFHSAITSAIYSQYAWAISKGVLFNFLLKNATQINEKETYVMSIFFITSLTLPFLIFLTAVVLLIFFLVKHSLRMRMLAAGAGSPGQSAHTSAVLSILSFIVLHFSHYMVAICFCIQKYQIGSLSFLLCMLVAVVYPSIHSIILIFVNPKLKQNAKALLLGLCKGCQ
ncbi:PREDICTED: taste receptor type 2 member 1 [Dipodomys ordii]|uniref:Taste receptor type 2 n=1 Tax=Dipodomys ordii TaxID=10020 RepID=A0A1S3F0J3_DIPOR|nr:PREDICTED: taste receptor type 2 member 1 [Dipodomys ordii]